MPERILIVRLGSLGDIVHALPVVAALRSRFPDVLLDWVVDERNRDILDLVRGIDHRVVLPTQSTSVWVGVWRTIRELRRRNYDVALDLQGLLKSAIVARVSGARRVVGFPPLQLRERSARYFHTETGMPVQGGHVVGMNLTLAAALDATTETAEFPLEIPVSPAPAAVRQSLGVGDDGRYVLLNPGAAWPNKRWPPTRFGELAKWLWSTRSLRSGVLWGPGERPIAESVAACSNGAAVMTPETSVADLVALVAEASLVVSGDTGPLHLAAAAGAPIVGIYGPTDPARNGPWAPDDVTVSRFSQCSCHHRRRCRATTWCVEGISTEEVIGAVDRRLATLTKHG